MYTVIDALAYVGGIFSSLYGAFFFMGVYGRFVFEMLFAQQYFHSKAAQSYGFFTFIKITLFNLWAKIKSRPNWKKTTKQQEIRDTVNKVLDIVYLQRRIEFLENSMTVLF